MHSSELRTATLPTTRFGEGYDLAEVDDLLDRCVVMLETLERGSVAGVQPDEVEHAAFRTTRFRVGYAMDAVDELLDRVVGTLRAGLGG